MHLESLRQRRLVKTMLIFSALLVMNGILDFSPTARQMSIYNEKDDTCVWTPPNYEIPDYIDWHKTLVVGFPSGDKRLAFMQMEGLTGWAARDEWAFEYLGMTNHPFIKRCVCCV